MNNLPRIPGITYVNPELADNAQLVALRDRLGRKVAETIQEISRASFAARANYRTAIEELDRAVWYPGQYISALDETQQSKRLKYFQEKNYAINGYVSKTFFKRGTDNFEFIAKSKVKPSEALMEVTKGPSLLDCGAVIQTARYRALLAELGEAKFNRLFGRDHGEPINLCFIDNQRQPMRYFIGFTATSYIASRVFLDAGLKLNQYEDLVSFSKKVNHESVGKLGSRLVRIGQVISFNNVPKMQYKLKHPFGMGSNYNVVCVEETEGNQLFCAHGIPPEGCSEEEICEFLASVYNDDDTQTEEMRASPQNQLHQAAIAQSRIFIGHKVTADQVLGYDTGSPQDFNLRLIQDLIDLELEKVNMDFVRNHPEALTSLDLLESTKPR